MGTEGVQPSSRLVLAFETRSVDVTIVGEYGARRSNQRGTASGDGAPTVSAYWEGHRRESSWLVRLLCSLASNLAPLGTREVGRRFKRGVLRSGPTPQDGADTVSGW